MAQLKDDIFREDLRHINTNSDSEVLLNVFAHELQCQGKLNIDHNDIFEAVAGVHRRCSGGYAAVVIIPNYGIVGFRDPSGIRPAVFGQRKTKEGAEYIVASESVAIDSLGFEVIRDLAPGEAIFISLEGQMYTKQCARNPQYAPCNFEHVYFARPDSIIDGISDRKSVV